MNKMISVMLIAAASTFAFDTWVGADAVYRIETGLDAGGDKSGYWFSYGDDADGGASKITWPVEQGNEYSSDALDPVIDECGGLCGTYSLDKGTLTYNPFVGVGFNIAGSEDADSDIMVPADATSMGGICISYSVDDAAALEMGLGDAGDKEIGYDNPFVSIPKSSTGMTKTFEWSKFKQAGWGSGKISGDEAAAKLVALKFKIQGASGTAGAFNIKAIGPLNGTCEGASQGIAKLNKSELNYKISGNTISFTKNVNNVKLVNLNGQEIYNSKSTKIIDLSTFEKGIYMLKADGITSHIMIK